MDKLFALSGKIIPASKERGKTGTMTTPPLIFLCEAAEVPRNTNQVGKHEGLGLLSRRGAWPMDSKFLRADELGIRLEIVAGLPIWEPHPVYKHQKAVDRIRSTIEVSASSEANAGCSCIHAADVYISFPDGSLKRPDISIFCREPEEEEEAIKLVPEAVIEVISKGYEAKDLEIAPQFYLAQGVKDVLVFNPYTLVVLHVRRDQATHHVSPVEIELACGCRCQV